MKDTYKKNFFNIISNPLKSFFTKTIYDEEINYNINKKPKSIKINSLINFKIEDYKKNSILLKTKKVEKKNFALITKKNEKNEIQKKEKLFQNYQKSKRLKKIVNKKREDLKIILTDQDFDSGEEIYLKKKEYKNFGKKLNFVKKKNKNKKIKKFPKKNIINLFEFIKRKNSSEFQNTRMYICKFCETKFLRASALGGHTSKHHPNLSKDYKYRTLSIKNRKIERKRIEYFNSLE